MTALTIRAMCSCGFAKEWKLAVLSNPFSEEMDVEFSLLEAIMRRAEPHGPHHCPKCQLRSVYLYFAGHCDETVKPRRAGIVN
jgi:hypothetical protein